MAAYQHIPTSFTDDAGTGGDQLSELDSSHSPSFSEIWSSNLPLQAKLLTVFNGVRSKTASIYRQLRPWSEFFDRSYFSAPEGVSEAISRLTTNFRHFYPNYMLLSVVCSSYILLINLSFALCILFGFLFYYYVQSEVNTLTARGNYNGTVSLFGKTYSTFQLYVGIAVYSLLAFYFTNGSSVLFWLSLTTIGVIVPHAAYRRPALVEPAFQFA